MRYVSIQQTIRYSICKISDIACGPLCWTVLVSWYSYHGQGESQVKEYLKTLLSVILWNYSTNTLRNHNVKYQPMSHLTSDFTYTLEPLSSLQWNPVWNKKGSRRLVAVGHIFIYYNVYYSIFILLINIQMNAKNNSLNVKRPSELARRSR